MQGLHGEGDKKFYWHGDWLVLDSERQNMGPSTCRLALCTGPGPVFREFWILEKNRALAGGVFTMAWAKRRDVLMLGPHASGMARAVRCRFFVPDYVADGSVLCPEGDARRHVMFAVPRCLQPRQEGFTFGRQFRRRRGACRRLFSGSPSG